MYRKSAAIAIAGKTNPTVGTRIVGKNEAVMVSILLIEISIL